MSEVLPHILETLDQEIQEALNQNVEAEKSNDGMDIIVAEIDLNTNYLRVASAMRPIVLYINGEQVYVQGVAKFRRWSFRRGF